MAAPKDFQILYQNALVLYVNQRTIDLKPNLSSRAPPNHPTRCSKLFADNNLHRPFFSGVCPPLQKSNFSKHLTRLTACLENAATDQHRRGLKSVFICTTISQSFRSLRKFFVQPQNLVWISAFHPICVNLRPSAVQKSVQIRVSFPLCWAPFWLRLCRAGSP